MKRFLQQWAVVLIASGFPLGCTGGRLGDGHVASQDRGIGHLAHHYGLTDAQKAQALDLFSNLEKAREPLEKRLDQTRQTLRDAVKSNSTSQIEQLTSEIGELTAQIESLEAKADASFHALLKPEQQNKWGERDHRGYKCAHRPGHRP